MYRLTNLTLDTTTTYKNKDLVYQALDRENAKVKHQEAEAILLVEELDKKGVVSYQEEISLPFDGIADSLFLNHGATTPLEPASKEKKRSFLKRSSAKNDQEPTSKEKQELRESLSDTVSKPNRLSFVKFLGRLVVLLLLSVSLALSGFAAILAFQQTKQVTSLTQQVNRLKSLQSETGKLDAFVRYFLPRYYSEQAKLEDFVSSKVDFKHPSGQLQSVILESVNQTRNQTYQLTYVLAVKDGEARSQIRLTVTVQEKPSAPYGYQIIKEPKQTHYPN